MNLHTVTTSRRTVIAGAAAAAAVSILRLPTSDVLADEDADALLDKAAQAMTELTSFKFAMRNEGGTTKLMDFIELESIEGAVQRPDKFTATATAGVAFMKVDVNIIGIGNDIFVSDPTTGGESYIAVSADDMTGVDIASVINPDALILRSVDVIEEPEIDGDDEIDDVDTTIVTGHFTVRKAFNLGGEFIGTPIPEEAGTQLLLDEPLDVSLWIDGEGYVRRVRIIGPILSSDDSGIARRIDLYDLNVPVEIEAPANVTPVSEMEG
jgi:LppX/LprAFG-like lipoprotein